MNNSFLDFILKDVTAKKTLISTMPVKTKTNKKKFNETLATMSDKYLEYKASVRNYLLAKSRSFEIKENDNSEELAKMKEKVESLGHVKFLLNPSNTYFEKMGFDNLLYQINNYYVFNFNSLNDIINGFLDKFDQAGIRLTSEDFNYTCYVHEYMTPYLEVRYSSTKNYEKVSEIFEQIYWINPQIVEHIELNLRKLIAKNEKKFENYIEKIKKDVMEQSGIRSYSECVEKLQNAYNELNIVNKENIVDIINMARSGDLDIGQFLEGNKIRQTAYDTLIPDTIDIKDEKSINKVVKALEKMQLNVEEYKSFLEFLPLFQNFRSEYTKLIPKTANDKDKGGKKEEYKGLKTVSDEIKTKESELEKLNKKIMEKPKFFMPKRNESSLKQLKLESVQRARELYELYKKYDKEYFNERVIPILSNTLTISDLLHLYYSYDYFKKISIKKVYNLNDYDEITKYSDNFDMYAMDPTNIIVDGVGVFEDVNIPQVITNKYRLNNLKVVEEDFSETNLDTTLDRIKLIIRENVINKSETDALKIWFMVQVDKFMAKEEKEEKGE